MTNDNLYEIPTATAFAPTAADVAGVHDWFTRYDALAAAGDVEALADLAVFPLNVVSDTPGADGAATQWSREAFVSAMGYVLGSGSGDVQLDSRRTPHFLTESMVLVITEATMTATGAPAQAVRYADVLIRRGADWAFQSMIQGGWGDQLGETA